MTAFTRRFLESPLLSTLTEIEAVNIIDRAPQTAFLGVGSGTVLVVGEFEDGPFISGGDSTAYVNPTEVAGILGVSSQAIVEVYSDVDQRKKFGGLGFVKNGVQAVNPCARLRAGELWNGNGYLKTKGLRAQKLMIARVDTSVGDVTLFPLAVVEGTVRGPFTLSVGDVVDVTTDQGGPAASSALAATVATASGAAFVSSTFVGGEQIGISIDGNAPFTVTFSAADQTPAEVAARINLAAGAVIAVVNAGAVDISGFVQGTDGEVALSDVTTGALALIGHATGVDAGGGNVGNILAVEASELATIINATVALTAIGVVASVTPDGRLRIASKSLAGGSVEIGAGPIQDVLGFVLAPVVAGAHAGGQIPAGTRVRTGAGAEWVTMQTLTIRPGSDFPGGANTDPIVVKVRPALDNGSAIGAIATAVNVLVAEDQPSFASFAVRNAQALAPSMNDASLDLTYADAFQRVKSITAPSRVANFMLSARRTSAVVRAARLSVIEASDQGCFGRKFITRSPLAFGADQAIADVAQYRSDRLYYTTIPMKLYVPEIAARGTDGGIGFTANGVIDVGADTALATLCASLAPEEDPGQQTALLGAWLGLGDVANDYTIETYTAFRRAGICAPRRDTFAPGLFFQSGVTSSTESGRTEIQRRNMADFVQDSLAIISLPYSKRNPTQQIRSAFIGDVDSFLATLKSEENPDRQRIVNYAIDSRSGNSPESEAMGIFRILVKVRTLSSMKFIEIPVEIGAGVVITDVAA